MNEKDVKFVTDATSECDGVALVLLTELDTVSVSVKDWLTESLRGRELRVRCRLVTVVESEIDSLPEGSALFEVVGTGERLCDF